MGEIVVGRLWEIDQGEPADREQKGHMCDTGLRCIEEIDVMSDDPLIEVRMVVYLISGGIWREHLDEEVRHTVCQNVNRRNLVIEGYC